jgi:hypothetical protein
MAMRIRLSRRRAQAVRRYPFTKWVVAWQRDRSTQELWLTFHWPRTLALLGVLALILWAGGTTVVWRLMQRHGYRSVTLPDLALPWRWSGIRSRQGGDLIDRGRMLAQGGRWDEAVPLLAAGLERAPDREGYLLYGRLCAGLFREADAAALLYAGLNRVQPDRAYLEQLFALAAAAGDMARAEKAATSLWLSGWGRGNAADREWLAAQKAGILLQQGKAAEAVGWLQELGAAKPPFRLPAIEMLSLTRLGRDREALGLCRQQPKDYLLQHEEVLPVLAGACYRTGDKTQALQLMEMLVRNSGGQPAALLVALDFLADKPDLQPAYDSLLEFYRQRFGSQEEPMARLGYLFLRHHDSVRLEGLLGLVKEHAFTDVRLELATVEALLYDGRVKEAGRLLARLPAMPENTLKHLKADLLLRLQKRLSIPAAGNPGSGVNELARHRLPLADYLQLAEILSRQGREADARELLLHARTRYPQAMQLKEKLG